MFAGQQDRRAVRQGRRKKLAKDADRRFLFWLASRVEHTTDVDGLAERIPYPLLQEWRAYCALEPFGDDWQQAATIAAAAFNPHSKRPLKPDELIPRYRPEQTPEDMQAALMAAAREAAKQHGG